MGVCAWVGVRGWACVCVRGWGSASLRVRVRVGGCAGVRALALVRTCARGAILENNSNQ